MALRENSLYDLLPIGLANAHIGELVIWLLLLTTWASDTFAYFAGVKWGKRKIVPISALINHWKGMWAVLSVVY